MSDVAVVFDKGQASYVPIRVPYAHRAAVQACSWRKWVPKMKAWMVPRVELPGLVARLEADGCPCRWTTRP